MDKLGSECVVIYRDQHTGHLVRRGGGTRGGSLEFIAKQFAAAKTLKGRS